MGTLTLDGDYEQAIYGRLQVEIGGIGGGESDLLVVTGQVLLDAYGYLDVIALPGLSLGDGDSIRVLTCASLQGEFEHFTGLCPLPGICLDVFYRPDGVVLVARELDPAGVEEIPTPEPQPAVTELPSSIRLVAQQGVHSGSLLELDLPDPAVVCLEVFNVTGSVKPSCIRDNSPPAPTPSNAVAGQAGVRRGGAVSTSHGRESSVPARASRRPSAS